ncbi:MAG: hypothetical protein IT379_03195, partial [Deltaproteobacteria bacterium]|nr:hypothetical protein [Deltaproteobacteria bacterium]
MAHPLRLRLACFGVATLVCALGASHAWAQAQPAQPQQPQPTGGTEDQAAAARELFREGVGFSDRSEWAPAADRFRRALALRNLPVIAHNLGVALARMGRVV